MRAKTVFGAAVLMLLGATYPAAAQMMPGGAWQGFYAGLNILGAWLDASGSLSRTGCFATVGEL